jgi:hypothetical protein
MWMVILTSRRIIIIIIAFLPVSHLHSFYYHLPSFSHAKNLTRFEQLGVVVSDRDTEKRGNQLEVPNYYSIAVSTVLGRYGQCFFLIHDSTSVPKREVNQG